MEKGDSPSWEKRNRGLCGRNNEAEAVVSTAAFLLWFCNNATLCILWIYLILEGMEPKEIVQFNLMWETMLLCVYMYTVLVSECMCISSVIHLRWIKPAVSIEWWPGIPRTQGSDGVTDHWVQT